MEPFISKELGRIPKSIKPAVLFAEGQQASLTALEDVQRLTNSQGPRRLVDLKHHLFKKPPLH